MKPNSKTFLLVSHRARVTWNHREGGFEWELRRAVCKHRRALGSGSRISIQCNHELLMAHMAAIVVATSCHKRQGERVYQIHDPWPAANTVPMLWLARRYRLTVCLSNARPICLESESLVGNRTRATRTCTCNRPENCDRIEDGTGRSRIRVYVVREFNKLEVIPTCTLNELCYYSWVEMFLWLRFRNYWVLDSG